MNELNPLPSRLGSEIYVKGCPNISIETREYRRYLREGNQIDPWINAFPHMVTKETFDILYPNGRVYEKYQRPETKKERLKRIRREAIEAEKEALEDFEASDEYQLALEQKELGELEETNNY